LELTRMGAKREQAHFYWKYRLTELLEEMQKNGSDWSA